MGIVTKRGDKGQTSLYGGKRVSKDNVIIEACGDIDELACYLGLAKTVIKNKKINKVVESIQKDLFAAGAEISAAGKCSKKLKRKIDLSSIDYLEENIKDLESKIALEKGCFYLSGAGITSSVLDVGRTIARKAERRIVTLQRRKIFNNKEVLIYFNRLSDLLYLLARLYDKNPKPLFHI